jgi:predicted TIM-barrel fold metal-dependent hydrolase
MPPNCHLVRQEHIPTRAACPVIDAHNHLWGQWDQVDQYVRIMDEVGVVQYADLTSNLDLKFVPGGYEFAPADIETFFTRCADRHPGRFFGFTVATFSRSVNQPLFNDANAFAEETVALLERHVVRGARGLKILKELGLHYRDGAGQLIAVDDPRLSPIWDAAGKLGIPVLLHQADPLGFFDPATPDNEHYDSLLKYPSWNFADTTRFPRARTILAQRDRLLARHPRTVFILAHAAGLSEDLGEVARILDTYPNACIDFSARLDELGRQPYTTREFMIRYQDRILFGTDMPPTLDMYRCYFRFLETFDEYFFPPDYDGTFRRARWAIYGIGLPPATLESIYFKNALRLIPGLKAP